MVIKYKKNCKTDEISTANILYDNNLKLMYFKGKKHNYYVFLFDPIHWIGKVETREDKSAFYYNSGFKIISIDF